MRDKQDRKSFVLVRFPNSIPRPKAGFSVGPMKITLIPDSLSLSTIESHTRKSIFALNWAGTAGKPTRNLLGTSRGIAKKRGTSLRNDFGWSNGVPLGSMSIAFWQLEYCFHPCAQYWKIAFLRLEMHFYCDCAVSTGRMSAPVRLG